MTPRTEAFVLLTAGLFGLTRDTAGNEHDPRDHQPDRSHAAEHTMHARNRAGVIWLLARHGHIVDWQSYGKRDLEQQLPMEKDTIVRLYSMSKVITSVAAMILVEEGRLRLDDRVDQFLPALGAMNVITGGTAERPLVARRAIAGMHAAEERGQLVRARHRIENARRHKTEAGEPPVGGDERSNPADQHACAAEQDSQRVDDRRRAGACGGQHARDHERAGQAGHAGADDGID
jgi:hypothetical protein